MERYIIQGFVIRGFVTGRKLVARPRRWIDNITRWIRLKINEAVGITEDRQYSAHFQHS